MVATRRKVGGESKARAAARKRHLEEAREVRDRLQSVIDAVVDAILVVDRNHRVVLANRAVRELHGGEDPVAAGRTCYQVSHHRESPCEGIECPCPVAQVVATKGPVTVTHTHTKADGGTVVMEIAAYPIFDEAGEVVQVIMSSRDITERKQAEEEVRRSLDTQTALNAVLPLLLEDISPEELASRALDIVLSIPWLSFQSRGAMFLVEDEPGVLVMKAQRGLSQPIQEACARVPLGRCVCGRAALTKETQFADCIDERHETSYAGIIPHGHYCVPILSGDTLLGLMNLYVREGHRRDPREGEFLTAVANALAAGIRRWQDNEAVKRAERKYRVLVESAPDPIFVLSEDGEFLAANGEAARSMGRTPEQMLGLNMRDLFPEEIANLPMGVVKQVFQTGTAIVTDTMRMRTVRGEQWYTATLAPIRDVNGRVTSVLGIARDITARKEAEEALRRSREELRAILDNVGIGIALIGPQMEVLELNRQMREWFPNVDAAQRPICYRAYNDPPRDDPCSYCPTIKTLQDGEVHESVTDTPTEQGVRHYRVVSSAIRDEKGEVAAAIEMVEDITEQRRAERKLRWLAAIAEQTAEGIAVANLEGVLQYVNAAWAQMHGYAPEEMIGKHLSVCHNEEQVERDVIPFNEQVARDGHSTAEVGHVRRDGTPFPTRMIVTVLRDEAGVPTGLIGFASDITHQKQAEHELAAAYRQLEITNDELKRAIAQAHELAIEAERANTAKSQFLANMSHEIRTPMNAIIGMLELALDSSLTAEQREYLATAKESSESLLGLINDILDLAKIEAGKLELETIDFHLRDSLGDALKALALRAHQKALELAFEVDADVPDVLVGDPMRLRQIITNLVGNAIKFTPQGQVVVRVTTDGEGDDHVSLHFSVADTGIGIPQDKRDSVFAAFEQVDGSATRKYGGTGLGLAICAQLVEAMGGRIWLESEVGKGSTFHFTAAFAISKNAPVLLRSQPVNLEGMPVLVVDDNPTNRYILEQLLVNWKMQPQAVGKGSEAIAMMREAARSGQPFAVLLVDVQMPEMDGFSLVERMRADLDLGDPAVILLTSAGQRGDAARCRQLGISAYLTKPVKQSELWDALMLIFGAQVLAEGPSPLITRHSLREGRRRLRILLAEDNVVNQKVALRMLEKRGHYVTVVGSGTEALAAISSQPFDLVLMDVQMPEMDGFEATAAIREQEKISGRHMPIIAMTAYAMEGDRQRCLAAGMDGYVSKPVASRELFAAIEGLVPTLSQPQKEVTMPPEEGKLVDKEAVLTRVDGDLELLKEIIQEFLDERPTMVAAIRDALADQNAEAIERAAHSLKGALGALGATSASEAALTLETLGSRGDLASAQDAWDTLLEQLDRVEPALVALRDEGQA